MNNDGTSKKEPSDFSIQSIQAPVIQQVLQQLKTAKAKLETEQTVNAALEKDLQASYHEIECLKQEIERLRSEIDRLKHRSTNDSAHQPSLMAKLVDVIADVPAGQAPAIPVQHLLCINSDSLAVSRESNSSLLSPEEKIAFFRALFLGRTDVYAVRWENEATGGSGYQPAREHNNRAHFINPKTQRKKCPGPPGCPNTPIDDDVIKQHLQGRHTIGTYPLLQDDTCIFLCIDLDDKYIREDKEVVMQSRIPHNHSRIQQSRNDLHGQLESWKVDAISLLGAARKLSVPAYLERSRSGKGGHLWIFFDSPVPAAMARRLGDALIRKANEDQEQIKLNTYDRMFPNQDAVPERGYGNLIALPLQKKPLLEGNSVFIDDNFSPYKDQWRFLQNIEKVSESSLNSVVKRAARAGELICIPRPSNTDGDDEKLDPWALPSRTLNNDDLLKGPLPPEIKITLANLVYISKVGLSQSHLNRLKRIAAFQNPKFYENQALRISNHDTPRIICCADDFEDHIALPRGLFEQVNELLELSGVQANIVDKRFGGERIKVKFKGELFPEQKKAADQLLQHHAGVLSAVTGFGKTVLAAYCISKRKSNTLILVHRQQLLRQWKERLSSFLELPDSSIGQIGAGKRKPTGKIDVATVQSLYKKGQVDNLVAEYGHVIVDECHGVAAVDFEQILRRVRAKWVLGLTATPVRYDGHHPIIVMQCGPIRYRVRQHDTGIKEHIVIPRITESQLPEFSKVFNTQEVVTALASDEKRNNLIVEDVLKSLADKRSPLVLTKRKEHLHILHEKLKDKVKNILVFQGGLSAKKTRQLNETLASIAPTEERVVLAIGECVGEGFDDARLDTLFLTMPISWRGRLEQYAGRLHRAHDGKSIVRIYDYVDIHIEKIYRMYKKRVAGYKRIGYKVQSQFLLPS